MNDAPTDHVETFHDSDHQYAKKLQTVHVCRGGGEGARSSLMRIEVELLRMRAWWKADGEENACLNRCKREFLEVEVVMMDAGYQGGKAGVTRGRQRLYVPFSQHRNVSVFQSDPREVWLVQMPSHVM